MPRNPPSYHPLNKSRFYKLQSRAKLAALFGLTRKTLEDVLAMEHPYSKRTEQIERNGKTKERLIQEPRAALRPIHIVIRKALSRIQPPDFLFCPVKRRSYAGNAAAHIGAREIRTLDIHAYFPSTPKHRVYWFFHTVMRCSEDVAGVLATLLTVDGALATGSTVSPILSFFAFYDMWLNIAAIAREAGCTLTVYMDDVTLSGDEVPERIVWAVRKEIYARGLTYHKERRYTGGFAEVTGTIIRDGRIVVPNRQLLKAHQARQAVLAATDPDELTSLNSRLRGLNEQRKQVTKAGS